MDENDFSHQIIPTDVLSVDHLIVSTITFLNIEQIYQKINDNNLDQPQFNRKFIEDRINTILFTSLNPNHFSNLNIYFYSVPLTEEEEFMVIFLAKFQMNSKASSLLTNYRYFFNFNHPFSSLLSQIEQNSSCNFNKQSSIVESYATTFAQLERICDDNEYSQKELENAQITQNDLEFISNSNNFNNDKSVPYYKVQIDTNNQTFPIEEIESNFSNLTQMLVKVFAFLQTVEISIPIIYKHFLIGDSDLSSEIDFDLKLIESYKPSENNLILALIMLKNDMNFYVENVGTGIIIIDGFQIWPGETTNLANNSVIEMCGCDFVFSINFAFMNKVKEIAMKIALESNDQGSTINNNKEENSSA